MLMLNDTTRFEISPLSQQQKVTDGMVVTFQQFHVLASILFRMSKLKHQLHIILSRTLC